MGEVKMLVECANERARDRKQLSRTKTDQHEQLKHNDST